MPVARSILFPSMVCAVLLEVRPARGPWLHDDLRSRHSVHPVAAATRWFRQQRSTLDKFAANQHSA